MYFTILFKLREYRGLLIRRYHEAVDKLKKGEVLITTITSPEFVPAMHRAIAIVTDEGGVLCHAAIVSREMNKPCIIGTKISTKILNDGDVLEVNTNEGTVKVVKRVK